MSFGSSMKFCCFFLAAAFLISLAIEASVLPVPADSPSASPIFTPEVSNPLPPFDPNAKALPSYPILTDPNGYETENNWLACIIGRRMVDFAGLAVHPGRAAPPDLKVTAHVDAESHHVHVDVTGFFDSPVALDLQPDFAWDPHGYAPLAAQLLGASAPNDHPAEALPDELASLLDLTGPNLATEDVRLSTLLQKHPAWAAAHEQAALLMVALALRDNAGDYSDSRRMLCRATAHLALAEALRGPATPGWAGKMADAGIRALAGREVDALAHLDALAAAADCPPAAKIWIDALRLRARDDWRVATPTADAPLLLRIAYFETLSDNLSDLVAIKRFEPLGDFSPVTDWGHAVLANDVQASVEGENRFCNSTLVLETAELAKVLELEGSPLDQQKRLGAQLSDPMAEQLFSGPGGSLRIIGPDLFKDFARQHFLLELLTTYRWLKYEAGLPDDAEKFRVSAWHDFSGMRLVELTWLFEKGSEPHDFRPHPTLEQKVTDDHATWRPWEIASGDFPDHFFVVADRDRLLHFYRDGLPFGTAYNVALRRPALEAGANWHGKAWVPGDPAHNPWMDYLRHSQQLRDHPMRDPDSALRAAMADPHTLRQTYPPATDLRALAPSSFRLFAAGRDTTDPGGLISGSRPWWDYDLVAIHRVENYSFLLDDATLDVLLQKHAVLEPDAYFQLGAQLRSEGKDDDAAEADRKGFDRAYDQVSMSNRVGPLVDYYYDHGRKDEALMVAKRAAGVYSERGLLIYCDLLEKLGRLTEAAQCAQDIFSRYQDHARLDELFAAHPDAFHDQSEALRQEVFPHGMTKVAYADFKDPPASGCRIAGTSDVLREASLQFGDVIVALDSYRVETASQYAYIRDMTKDPRMDLIIWRNSRYLIAHTSAPDRRFGVKVETYPAK